MNQVPLFYPLHLDWFHVFAIMAFLFNSFNDYDVSIVCHQLQGNVLSHSAREEDDYFIQIICKVVQIDLSSFIANWESHSLINPYGHYSIFDDCHSFYHFPTNISNDSCFTSLDLHRPVSHYSDFFRAVEALQLSSMVMSGPHYFY